MAPKAAGDAGRTNSAVYKDKSKPTDIRLSNINAAKGNQHLYFKSEITRNVCVFASINWSNSSNFAKKYSPIYFSDVSRMFSFII